MTSSHGKVIKLSGSWLGIRWERVAVFGGLLLFVVAFWVALVWLLRTVGV